MPVPSFQEMFLPVLQQFADGKTRRMADVVDHVANYFNLTQEDREDPLPSGQGSKLANRVGWCRTHLKFAGLIQKVSWGHYTITDAGLALVKNPPPKVDLKFLDTIPAHFEWFHQADKESGKESGLIPPSPELLPPKERLGTIVAELHAALITELREELSDCDPFRFEQIVLDLLLKMGYGGSRAEAAQVTQKTGDGGIDGVINEDRLGLDVIYIQAKRWKNNVGRPEIQNFVGALAGKKASKGVFITTSDFHANAREYAAGLHQKVILIDGRRLAELMIEHNIGVAEEQVFKLKRIDSDYFAEDAI
jgi:restriction system protein